MLIGTDITQYEILRNPQIACDGMAVDYALRKIRPMVREGLKRARKAAGLTQQQIAERMNVSVPQISRWENGVDGIPSQRFPSLQRAYEASLADILEEGEVGSHLSSNAKVVVYEGASDVTLVRDIPIYGTSLGAPRDFNGKAIEQTMLNTGDVIGYLPRPPVLNGQEAAYGLYVQGSSMAPRYDDGDTIFATDCRKSRPPRIGDDVVVYLRDVDVDDGETAVAVLVKRLVRRSSSVIELQQYEPAMTFTIESDRVLRLDRVIPLRELLS